MPRFIPLLLCLFFTIPSFQITLQAQQTAFTAEDAIKVKSLASTTLSRDGAYLAGLRSESTKNRFGVDHFRFRDPSYLRPAHYELVVYALEGNTSQVVDEGNIRSLNWSPDGSKLAYFKIVDDQYQLFLFDRSSKKMAQVNLQSNHMISASSMLEWMPDNRSVLLSLRGDDWLEKGMDMYKEAADGPLTVYNSEEPFLKWDALGIHDDLYVLAKAGVDQGVVEMLLPEGHYSDVRVDEKGEFVVYREDKPLKTSYNRKDGFEYTWKKRSLTNPSDTAIIQEKTKERKQYVFSEDNRWMAWADSGHVIVQSLLDNEAINLTKDKNQLSATDTTEVKFSVGMWSKEATQLVARSKQGLWLIDREAGTVERFMEFDPEDEKAPRYGVEDWSPDGRQLFLTYSATDKWERGLFQYDFEKKELVELLKSNELYRSWQMSKDGSCWAYRYSDGDHPDELFVADAGLNNRKQITNLNPWVKNKKFTKSELVKYLDADGKELYGILYYPVDYDPGKKYPLVCEIYERFFDNGYRYSMNIVANNGYFGFRPSVNLEEGRPGVAWIKGVTAGINKLIERGLVDPDKIGVHGTSYGGYAASLLIAQTDRFAAAINISGKTNMISFLGDSPRIGTRNYAVAEVGQDRIGESLWEAPMKYIEHSAIMYADRMNTPHLLLTGEGDWNVPAANTRELYYALRRLGKKVVWVNYKTAGHGAGWAGTEETYLDQWKRMLDWYAEHFEDKDQKKEKP
jgi:dipeptidyl aminopeptidase/acylaminoacyl peptidase